jgi:hypothetical protein
MVHGCQDQRQQFSARHKVDKSVDVVLLREKTELISLNGFINSRKATDLISAGHGKLGISTKKNTHN